MKSLRLRNRFFVLTDILMCFVAYFLILLLRYNMNDTFKFFVEGIKTVVLSSFLFVLLGMFFNVYSTDWVYAGSKEYVKLVTGCFIAGTINVCLILFLPVTPVTYLKFSIASNVLSIFGICMTRFFLRIIYNLSGSVAKTISKRILVIGAGHLAVAFLRDLSHNKKLNYRIVGLIDDDPSKKNFRYYGSKVLGNRDDIERICDEKNVEEIVFAIYSLDPKDKAELLDICSNTGKRVRILQSFAASINDIGQNKKEIRDIAIEDLLERDPISLDNQLIQSDIFGKVVLVTGAGGSIGSELCRQISKYQPHKLIIFDIYENSTYELENELHELFPQLNLITLIGSVRDKVRLNDVFETYKPQIVFHAAAHKHVPLMEDSPCEAIKNNVFGTYNVACCADEYGVKRFVMISTDKAVNPTNVMGATKRMCEMIVQTMQNNSTTEFVAVRFGNVLGSNGSVIPRFKKQIEHGGPVTVTHPEITRFFMTIPEAAQLVLQAAAYAKGGEIFVLDMGQPVKIYDLAQKMIRLSGYKPDVDIKIEFTGLRPGEKLYEELLMNEEGLEGTKHKKIFVGKPGNLSMNDLNEKLDKLEKALEEDSDDVKRIISEVVPTYVVDERTLSAKA